ncbi:phosphatidylserine/phosphatidylglycerophosphate/cardiolipin synthase family protein [Actinomadura sp. 21ATH]|uniref:phospholipase D-like domain-containing protein n=1 Tax=Actinomadura sp. 21ATH TaxID=1735444 RepID=UPI0035BFA6C0
MPSTEQRAPRPTGPAGPSGTAGITEGNALEFLVDNEAAWGRLAGDIAAARSSVRAMVFMLDAPYVRLAFERDPPAAVRPEVLLLEAARRGADVRLVLNHVTPAFSPANTTWPVERFFRRHDPEGRVRVRRLRTPQTLPIHAKVIVIDDRVAYLVGSVFSQEYFDGRRHLIEDPRRGAPRWRGALGVPVHDVSVRVEGPAVADLDDAVRLHWEHAEPSLGTPGGTWPRPSPGPAGKTAARVTRTLAGNGRFAGRPGGETGIRDSYLRALSAAERLVYLENQYLTCPEMVDALVGAVRRAPDLELILLLNIRPDVPYYVGWQREALERLLAGVGAAGRDRVGVFTLWSHETREGDGGGGRTRILRDHVHSKVAIVDDSWLTVGSANLDGLSLSHSQHELRRPPLIRLGRPLGAASLRGDPWQARASEVNLAVDGDEAGRLRRDLWAEHLGLPGGALAERPGGGWLGLWHERARSKLDGLRAPVPAVSDVRVLPYPHRDGRLPRRSDRPRDHLRALGVDPERVEVLERAGRRPRRGR